MTVGSLIHKTAVVFIGATGAFPINLTARPVYSSTPNYSSATGPPKRIATCRKQVRERNQNISQIIIL